MASSSKIAMRFKPSPKNGNTYDHKKSSFNFELLIDPLVLERIIPQLLVETIALGRLDYTRGEDLKRKTVRFDHGYPSYLR